MRSITVNDGLPQGSVTGLAQDNHGFVWVASDGISRFDGRKFLHFRHVDGDSLSLLSNNIQYFRMGDMDNLWITFVSRDTDVFNTRTKRARHISSEKGFEWMNPDSLNPYFIAQEAGKYFKVSLVSLTSFDVDNGNHIDIPVPPREYLLGLGTQDKSKVVAVTNKGLYEICENKFRKIISLPPHSADVEKAFARAVMFRDLFPSRIVQTKSGALLIPSADTSYIYQPETRKLKGISTARTSWGIVEANGTAYTLADKGLISFDEDGQAKVVVNYEDVQLTDAMLLDQSGILWAGTAAATGIRLFDFKGTRFRSYNYDKGFAYDVMQPWFRAHVARPVVYGSYQLRNLKDTAGNIWLISHHYSDSAWEKIWPNSNWKGRGAYKLVNGMPIKLAGPAPDHWIIDMTFDDNNQAWAIVNSSLPDRTRLVKVDTRTAAMTDFANLPLIPTENSFLTSVQNLICVVTEEELRLYDRNTRACKIYSAKELQTDGMLLMATPDPRAKNILWIATKGSGIIQLNTVTNRIIKFTESNGLPNNTVYYMAADKRGIFWCSSNKGIFTLNPSDKKIRSFFVRDGLQGNEFNRYHFFETPEGQFIFGGTEGYTVFHPDSIHVDDFQTPAVITGLTVNNKAFPLPASEGSQTLTLNYNQNIFSLSFAGLQFIAPDELHYRYKLTGIDNEWVNAGNDSSARYTSIPPGKYTFLIIASNTAGIWSDKIAGLEIIVLPPWWKTWWAYLGYLLIVTAIIYALYKTWLFRAKDKQRIILQQKETEQLKAMDEIKSRFFNNITHEFRTPLSLIIAPLEQIQIENTDPVLARRLNGLQNNAENLLQLINQLLDISKLEAKSMSAKLVRGNLVGFINEIAEGFLMQAEKSGLELKINLPEYLNDYDFDAANLRKIVQNMLSNAVKFTPAGGSIQVSANLSSVDGDLEMLELKVADTGIGIPADQLTNVFKRFYQIDDSRTRAYNGTGIGLALAKELTELLGGSIKATQNDPEAGTTFTLTIPVMKAGAGELPKLALQGQFRQAISSAARKEELTDTTKPLILLAEDHIELATFITDLFSENYRVISAPNGKLGWEMAQQELPNLIISDMMMPEMDGLEFCSLVKNNPATSHIGFLMLTAKSSGLIAGLQHKADEYLTKPFHTEELLLRVANMIERQDQLRNYYNSQLTSPEQPILLELPPDPFLQNIYQQIDAHLDDVDYTIDQLATAVNMSARTLVRKLHVIAGMTPVELLKQYRLKKAAELLLTGTPVSEVAWSVGYGNRNYFSTAFKAFYGVSPSEYLKSEVRK